MKQKSQQRMNAEFCIRSPDLDAQLDQARGCKPAAANTPKSMLCRSLLCLATVTVTVAKMDLRSELPASSKRVEGVLCQRMDCT